MNQVQNFDVNGDGKVDANDVEVCKQVTQIQTDREKDKNQVRLAWFAMLSMIIVTFFLFSPWVPDSRILALKDTLDLFYIAQASVIGFYVGANTYLSKPGPKL